MDINQAFKTSIYLLKQNINIDIENDIVKLKRTF